MNKRVKFLFLLGSISLFAIGTVHLRGSYTNLSDSDVVVKLIKEESREFSLPSFPVEKGRVPVNFKVESPRFDFFEVREAELKWGDSLFNLLISQGLERDMANRIVYSVSDVFDIRKLKAGTIIPLYYDQGYFRGLSLDVSYDQVINIFQDEGGSFTAREYEKDLTTVVNQGKGEVVTTLFEAAQEAGIPDGVTIDVMSLLSFDVDFQREIHVGDKFHIIYESIIDNENDSFVRYGSIHYAKIELVTAKNEIEFFRFVGVDDEVGYYNGSGESVNKALLKTPVNGARISSLFGLRRDPFSGFTSSHKGVDFAVRRGTPIMSGGNGVIVERGWHSVYGNYIKIRHSNRYDTLYAHMSSFARGTYVGKRVNQRETIGYVGSTGRSTGPHLHYEIHYNRRPINPLTVRFPSNKKLRGEELVLFKKSVAAVKSSYF